MPLATYKDLCIDASDAPALAAFWSRLLGWPEDRHGDGPVCLRDRGRAMVWVNPVPEPVTAKNRLHIDVNAESLEPALAAGARVVDDSHPWTVLSDPDGQLFCLFRRDPPIDHPFYELGWDVTGGVAECRRLADWWAGALGATVNHDPDISWVADIRNAPFQAIDFAPVPEAKVTKNRVHIDVTTPDVSALLAAGARRIRAKGDGIGWDVLVDPEGNEFCAFTPD
ncbi:VOC family protein [Intrasporangium sp. DVR]|uniref:VOC family protein n=1 Tax=Intrasporangium sp. DVR TaxID=3127867 RepID=UPI00313A6252